MYSVADKKVDYRNQANKHDAVALNTLISKLPTDRDQRSDIHFITIKNITTSAYRLRYSSGRPAFRAFAFAVEVASSGELPEAIRNWAAGVAWVF